jgi:hypothetical protein
LPCDFVLNLSGTWINPLKRMKTNQRQCIKIESHCRKAYGNNVTEKIVYYLHVVIFPNNLLGGRWMKAEET